MSASDIKCEIVSKHISSECMYDTKPNDSKQVYDQQCAIARRCMELAYSVCMVHSVHML